MLPPSSIIRLTLATLITGTVAACATGTIATRKVVDPYAIPEPQAASLPALSPGAIPTPAVSRACRGRPSNEHGLAAAVRPGVGAHLHLMTWSAGLDPTTTGVGNTHPPVAAPVDVAVRLLGPGGRLDPAEQRTLATFLTTNRTAWGEGSTSEPSDSMIGRAERQALLPVLERNEAALWNAFVRSLCLEIWQGAPSGAARMFVPLADMAALCQSLPRAGRPAFARSFIDERAKACPSTPTFRGLIGVDGIASRGSWAGAALSVAPKAPGARYYDGAALGSPIGMLGQPEIDTIYPAAPDAPPWSLAAWEASGICRAPDNGAFARIVALRLRGGARDVAIVERGGPVPVLSVATDGIVNRLVGAEDRYLGDLSLARADLATLTALDVDQLVWAAPGPGGIPRKVDPPGCSRIH